jgi:predicted metal-dependent peptidase
MGWQDRRRVLLDVCGDITDAEVIAATHDLRELPAILTMPGTENQLYTVDAYKRIAVSKKAEINRQLQTSPRASTKHRAPCLTSAVWTRP